MTSAPSCATSRRRSSCTASPSTASTPEASAAWWGEVFGVEPRNWDEEGDWWSLEHATPDEVLTIDFAAVPEPKTVKNRIHWDVRGKAADLEAHGATRLWEMPRWVTLADPEGNEFCVFE